MSGLLNLCVIVFGEVVLDVVLWCDVVCDGDDVWVFGMFGDVCVGFGVVCGEWMVGVDEVVVFWYVFEWFELCVVFGFVFVGVVYVVFDLLDGLVGDFQYILMCLNVCVEIDVDVVLCLVVFVMLLVDV